MLNKNNIYIISSIAIGFLVVALLGWAIFLVKKEKVVKETARNTSFLAEESKGSFGFSKDTFGKVIKEIKNTANKKELEKKKEEEIFKPKLTQLHIAPIAGSFVSKTQDIVFFTERGNGHVFTITLDSETKTKRILNTTVPSVQDSLWTLGGAGVIRRYTDENNNIASVYSAITIDKKDGENSVTKYLPNNIDTLAVSPGGKQLFYTITDKNGVNGYISGPQGEESELIWTSWIRKWSASWIDDTRILVTQAPASGLGGAAFTIDTKATNEELVIAMQPGLITNMNPKGDMLLYSNSRDGNVSLFVRDIKERSDKEISLSTFADKCVWAIDDVKVFYCFVPKIMPNAKYPDAWYQGLVHFADQLWKVNSETGETEMLSTLQINGSEKLDAMDISLSASKKYIFFTNNTNQTLWSIKIKEDEKNEKTTE